MKTVIIPFLVCGVLAIVYGNTINNIRLNDHTSYMVKVIGETVRRVEEMEWCNLKVNDILLDLDENVLGTEVVGSVQYTNGFVTSIQWVDIVQQTVQQFWRFDRVRNTTTVEIRGAMRMHDVTLGFDVIARFDQDTERFTAVFTYPLITFDFMVIKDMKKMDELQVTVLGTLPSRNANTVRILPDNKHSQTFGALYDWNSNTISIQRWGSEIFQPIAYKLVTTEIEFPTICYNCPVT